MGLVRVGVEEIRAREEQIKHYNSNLKSCGEQLDRIMTDIETNSSGEAFDALKAYYTDKVKPCFEASDAFYTKLAAYLDSMVVQFQEVDMDLAKSISSSSIS